MEYNFIKFRDFAYFVIVTEVQTAKYLENISSRSLPVETIFLFFQFIEHGVIEILEHEIKPFSSAKHFDHVHQILMT